VTASFVLFAINQAGEASNHQVEALRGTGRGPSQKAGSAHSKPTLRTRIEELSEELTSPFSGVTGSSSSQWTIRGVKLLLTLLVFGIGAGFLTRVMRMHS
jgi:hypothetical protein